MKNNPLKQLEALGQSIWLDYIRRDLIVSGGILRLIEEDGLRGMTSNPAIFEKAIVDSPDYDEDVRAMARDGRAKTARGQVAIASAKLAYRIYNETFASDRFRRLMVQGARTQRLLWASTGAKNPAYSDVKYVEALIGPDTVNTVPLATLAAYRDHGEPKASLEEDVAAAARLLRRLPELGLSLDSLTQQLEDEGVEKFNTPFDTIINALAQRSSRYLGRTP